MVDVKVDAIEYAIRIFFGPCPRINGVEEIFASLKQPLLVILHSSNSYPRPTQGVRPCLDLAHSLMEGSPPVLLSELTAYG